MEVLDQYSIIDCDSVFDKHNFHLIGSVVSSSIFCLNWREFPGFEIYLIDVFLN